jgi:hypothetical protein
MNDYELQAHRYEHDFSEVGQLFAKFSSSATRRRKVPSSQQPAYLSCTFKTSLAFFVFSLPPIDIVPVTAETEFSALVFYRNPLLNLTAAS